MLRPVMCLLAGLAIWNSAGASPLVYTPVNPSFGGNPLNGPNLLNEANAENTYSAPAVKQSPADRLAAFATALQNAILSRVQSAAIQKIVNVDGGLIPGTVETQDFIISVVDKGNGLTEITTTDRTTGATSTFDISSNATASASP